MVCLLLLYTLKQKYSTAMAYGWFELRKARILLVDWTNHLRLATYVRGEGPPGLEVLRDTWYVLRIQQKRLKRKPQESLQYTHDTTATALGYPTFLLHFSGDMTLENHKQLE